jgi:hypothetical protein
MTDIVKTNGGAVAPANPLQIIQDAVAGGVEAAQLGQLLDLQLRFQADEARKAYVAAMAAFKANPPTIWKDKTVHAGKATYSHVSLEFASKSIMEGLAANGMVHDWESSVIDGVVSVTCYITHEQGHRHKGATLTASPDNSGSKNSVQAIGSTTTYLQRYTQLMTTGLAVGGLDDDGIGSTFLTDDEVAELQALIEQSGTDIAKFCAFMKVDSLARIPGEHFRKARLALVQKVKKGTKS